MEVIEQEKLADAVLLYIRQFRRGRLVSYSSLITKFKTDYPTLKNALKLIKDWKYKIIENEKGVLFVKASDVLTATEIAYNLKTKNLGHIIHAYKTVKSTNDIASFLAESGEKEGTVIVAEEQTQGKGRLGRLWHSPPKAGIYLSIILKPSFTPDQAPGIAIMTALALANSLLSFCKAQIQIKWPNDVLINGKKIAGILTELSAEKKKINHIIVGVGININHKKEDFSNELKTTATSLRIINNKKSERIELLQLFLKNFEKEYLKYKKNGLVDSIKKIRKYSSLIGAPVKLDYGKKIIEGIAVDIDKTGALILEKDGKKIQVNSGEVTVVKNN